MALVNQTAALTDLSFLLGETTVPTGGDIGARETYIQRTLERVYRAYRFPMNQLTATFPMVNGVGQLPSNVGQDGIIDIRDATASGPYENKTYGQVDYQDMNNYQSGDYAYWIDGYEGDYTIYSSETSVSTILTVRFESTVPLINASIATPFPSSMVLAQGALKYYRQAEDPYADLTPYELNFQTELNEVISAYNRDRPQPRGRTKQEQMGTYTGDITTMGGYVASGNE